MTTVVIDSDVEFGVSTSRFIEILRRSGLPYPVRITSALRHGDGTSWHDHGLAADQAVGYGVSPATSTGMAAVAAFWYGYSSRLLELIHTFPDGGGYYVKGGVRISGFSAQTNADHVNHVHVAASLANLDAILASLPPVDPTADVLTDINRQDISSSGWDWFHAIDSKSPYNVLAEIYSWSRT